VRPEVEPVTTQSIKQLMRQTVGKWEDINASRLGAALSYYTMLSTAPLLILSIAVAGMVFGEKAARGQIVYQIQNLVGYQGGQAIQTMLENAHKPGAGLVAGLFGVLTLLFGASGVFIELRDSMNLIWGVHAKKSSGWRGMIRERFTSFAMVFGIGFLLMVSLLASAAIAAAGTFFGSFLPVSAVLLSVVNAVISFCGVTLAFALLYKVVPDARIEWRDVWIGALVTAALFSVGKLVIGLYLGTAGLGSAYGAAGSLVVFLVWVYYSAQIFFLGAAFTRAFAERHGSRAETREVRQAPAGAHPTAV
jgi:membrane protein